MSTRKTKMNADSPTPNSGSESAPATPKGRKRLIRKKIEKPEDKDDLVKKINDKSEKVENNKIDTKEKLTKIEKETPTKKRAKNISKDDLALLGKVVDKASIRPKRKSSSAIILAKAQKKKALSPKTDSVKRGRKRRNSTGKIDVQRKQSERLRKDDTIRKGRSSTPLKTPEKLTKGARKRLHSNKTDDKPTKRIKKEKEEPSSDSELLAASRRRSDSTSKCSDLTDASSLMDMPLNQLRDTEESLMNYIESPVCVDEKVIDGVDSFENKIEVKDKVVEQLVAPALNDSVIASECTQVTKVEFISPRAVTPVVKDDVKDNHIDLFNSDLMSTNVLTVATPEMANDEKENSEKSLSPVLESEGISEISVKQFYGQPDFLENNLGIEEDPKLGEIVQVRDKTKFDPEIEQEIVTELIMTEIRTTEEEPKGEDKVSVVDEDLNEIDTNKTDIKIVKDGNVTLEVTTNGVHELVPVEINVEESPTTEMDEKLPKPHVEEKLPKSVVDEPIPKLEVVKEVEESTAIEKIVIKTDDEIVPLAANSPKQTITRDEPMIEPENKENVLINFKDSADDKKNIIPINDDKPDASIIPESPERLKQKESHFLTLGLLSHKAAVAAKIEKQKRREQLHSNSKPPKSQRGSEYTGTLKTVIKLPRPVVGDKSEKKKAREPLKMTLHKGRGKPVNDKETASAHNSEDDHYYTIQNEQVDNNIDKTHGAQSRKTHNRNHSSEATIAVEPDVGTIEIEKVLVIPEKASSFNIHPGKICQDQCFYCGGKFGLLDTPSHVAQIKSAEIQQMILKFEAKLNMHNCLCDGCYRHFLRLANLQKQPPPSATKSPANLNDSTRKSSRRSKARRSNVRRSNVHQVQQNQICIVTRCKEMGSNTVRRKWCVQMQERLREVVNLNVEGLPTEGPLSICDSHYGAIGNMMVCGLCKRKLMRNHIYYISEEAEKRLHTVMEEQGIPISVVSSSVLCKLCKYYAKLMLLPEGAKNQKSMEGKSQKTMFVKNYRKRLIQFNNMEATDNGPESKAKSNGGRKQRPQKNLNKSTGRRGRPPKRPRPSQESASSPPSVNSDSGDKSSNQSTGEVMLGNDVTVDYDPPAMYSMVAIMNNNVKPKGLSMTIEPKPSSSKEDISILRGNPNISLRELFTGEEEMGLQVNIPFNSGGQRTPEGWTKVSTTVQYDEPTRHLWEELQKPYGNQSSFLRHLILLEKYYRNGDLVLTPGATFNAVNYSESVQQRLHSFDSRRLSNSSLINLYKMANSPISIIPTTKPKPKPSSTETTSLLKSSNDQQKELAKQRKQQQQMMQQQKIQQHQIQQQQLQQQQQIQQHHSAKTQAAKREQILASALRSATKLDDQNKSTKQGAVPPELISINSTKPATAITTTPNPQPQQQTPNVAKSSGKHSESSSMLIPSTSSSGQKKSLKESKMAANVNIIRLPDVLSPTERLESNRWRPTLMPVSAGPPALDGQLYQSADGRKLPNLVQVQSGGKPYLISIHDYNRMCIMRRERLLREQMIERQQQSQQTITNQQQAMANQLQVIANQQQAMANHHSLMQKIQHPSTGPNGTQQQSVSLLPATKSTATPNLEESTNKISMSITQIPNKILEQNSVIPLNSKSSTLDSLLKVRKTNPTSLLKPNLQNSTSTKSCHTMNQQNVISITSTPSISAILGVQPPAVPSTSRSPTSAASSTLDALIKTSQQATQSNMRSWAETLNNNGSVVIDNSAATLLSKIPKSLTVIPQQKSRSSKSSSED